ncbi:hypothetical protein BCV70DRAFT_202398 [Testicularia cyperi]|uniref:Uncharacterized protein n=1 Tax=Testicularia cyperi TaxID=1882483 RepID=A0A317XJ65_9BASI|nr:hypothetical protein BCV70DRAFT_202398 [Testicularia cyperi]
MFVPRKVKVPKQPRESSATGPISTTKQNEPDSVGIHTSTGVDSPQTDKRSPSQSQQASLNQQPEQYQHPHQHEPGSDEDEAKAIRLAGFLFDQLSPISLSYTASISSDSPETELVQHLLRFSHAPSGDKSVPLHTARILALPRITARCKTLSNLAAGLAKLCSYQLGWFDISSDGYQVHFSTEYINVLAYLSEQRQRQPRHLEPSNIVYIESLPPVLKTQVEAAGYVSTLLAEHEDKINIDSDAPSASAGQSTRYGKSLVLAVYEPTRSGFPPPPFHSLPTSRYLHSHAETEPRKHWISGRGFFVLSSPRAVEHLEQTFTWALDNRILLDSQSTDPAQRHAIRCLSLHAWRRMKEEYLAVLQQPQQPQQRIASATATAETLPSLSPNAATGSKSRSNGKRKRKAEAETEARVEAGSSSRSASTSKGEKKVTTPAGSTAARTDPLTPAAPDTPWYRGTILTIPCPDPNKPSTSPAAISSLKARLEKHVPESISYIHLHDGNPKHEETGDKASQQKAAPTYVIRTAHPCQARRLIQADSNLEPLPPDQEDKYWLGLPPKIRAQAQKRRCALDAKFSSA